MEALVQVQTVDPFEYLSSPEPEKSFEGISLRSIRAAVEDYKTVEPTVDHSGATLPALVSEDKMQLSRNVENEIVHDLPNNKTRWGMRLILVRVGEIHPPPDLMKALERKIIEPIERQAEKTQSQARREQTEEIIGLGVDPNIAYPGALVDAGKAGATVSGTTIRGFEKIGPALANLGDLGRGLTDALGGRAPKGPKK
ncbi:MAG: SPFH domain-containing protein [Patescibacteria group bacterium]